MGGVALCEGLLGVGEPQPLHLLQMDLEGDGAGGGAPGATPQDHRRRATVVQNKLWHRSMCNGWSGLQPSEPQTCASNEGDRKSVLTLQLSGSKNDGVREG